MLQLFVWLNQNNTIAGRKDRYSKVSPPSQVKIKIFESSTEEPRKPRKTANQKEKSFSERAEKKQRRGATTTPNLSKQQEKSRSSKDYRNLLPSSEDLSKSSPIMIPNRSDERNDGGSPVPLSDVRLGELIPIKDRKIRQRIQVAANPLSVHLDIPLVLRRQLEDGVAHLILVQKKDSILVEKLMGQPALKAALFDALNEKLDRKQWQEIFSSLHSKRITLTLYYFQELSWTAVREFDQQTKVFQNKILFTIKRNKERPQRSSNGISLPDKHAEKAKLRDKIHLRRLENSKAYQSDMAGTIMSFRQ